MPHVTDLKSIGEILRQKREEHSYTLEHVSEITRITLSCLRNIEEGNLEELPGLVFVRGFVRNYAKLLGLESDWMIEALNQAYENKGISQPSSDAESIDMSEEDTRGSKRVAILTVGIAIVLVVAVAAFFGYRSNNDYVGITKNVETVQAIDQDEVSEAAETKVLEEITEDVVTNQEIEEKPVISPLTLTLVALKNEWIRLSIDSNEPQDMLLTKGNKYDWPANEEYTLIMTTGDTASIHLNGEEINDREDFQEQLYKIRLDKFTLTRINNQ